jgi:hypothetical protein
MDIERRVDEIFTAIPWHDVIKVQPVPIPGSEAEFRPVLQRERFLSDLSRATDTVFVQMDRRERYFPIKQRDDMDRLTPRVKAMIEKQTLFAES